MRRWHMRRRILGLASIRLSRLGRGQNCGSLDTEGCEQLPPGSVAGLARNAMRWFREGRHIRYVEGLNV
jgi:hypothetical protein